MFYVGLWKDMFWSEVIEVYVLPKYERSGILTFIFYILYTDIYILLMLNIQQ